WRPLAPGSLLAEFRFRSFQAAPYIHVAIHRRRCVKILLALLTPPGVPVESMPPLPQLLPQEDAAHRVERHAGGPSPEPASGDPDPVRGGPWRGPVDQRPRAGAGRSPRLPPPVGDGERARQPATSRTPARRVCRPPVHRAAEPVPGPLRRSSDAVAGRVGSA